MDGRPLVTDADFEAEGERWFQRSLNALVGYHRTEPNTRAKQAYCNAFERHVRSGHPLTPEAVQEAVNRSVASWKAKDLAGAPRIADPVIAELAGLINPFEPSSPTANGGAPAEVAAEPKTETKPMDSWTRQGIVRQLIQGAEREDPSLIQKGEALFWDTASKLHWDSDRTRRELNSAFNEVLQHARDFTAQANPDQAQAMRRFVTRYRSDKTEAALCPAG
jgi:hypothetical protein